MGFWGKIGRFAGRTVIGVIAPGALAGWDYGRAKQMHAILKGYDEALEPLFNGLAALQKCDGWSELLVELRSFVVKFMTDEKAFKPLLKTVRPMEQGRTCRVIAQVVFDEPLFQDKARQHGVEIGLLRETFYMSELLCQELDERIAAASLEPNEEYVVRMLFDGACTRNPQLEVAAYMQSNRDVHSTMDGLVETLFSRDGQEMDDDEQKFFKELKVSYDTIKSKMLRK